MTHTVSMYIEASGYTIQVMALTDVAGQSMIARFKVCDVSVVIILFLCVCVFTDTKTFVKEYEYQAKKADNEISCRAIARQLLSSDQEL